MIFDAHVVAKKLVEFSTAYLYKQTKGHFDICGISSPIVLKQRAICVEYIYETTVLYRSIYSIYSLIVLIRRIGNCARKSTKKCSKQYYVACVYACNLGGLYSGDKTASVRRTHEFTPVF